MRQQLRFELFGSEDPTAAMKDYIREHFSDLLGPHVALLDEPEGLELLAVLVRSGSLATLDRN